MLPDNISYVTDAEALREMHLKPMSRATDKVLTALDEHCRAIIGLAPFCVISTQGRDGADVSPRGDPPGFIRILDDTHLLLPDRIGNNRLDNFLNLIENPKIGMLILVPGMDETLRLNGTARITDDARLLDGSAIRDRAPKIGLVIAIEEVFLHCSKALVRSKLWGEENRIERRTLPTYTEILTDHVAGLTLEESERQAKIMAERGLY
ncbi:MAG: pyridoxamine 5'-phosphate oxidase family protein [Alphaproteobacteria bacterium]|nr:pyridoxamine 5'-phosphate oxidase family protein [Alphaproteobacteria bacterium]